MANNYEEAATVVRSDALAPNGAVRIQELFMAIADNSDEWCGGLDVQAQPDGSLYISSSDDWFAYDAFCELISDAAKESLLLKSFGVGVAWYCSKLRPDEFGGAYHRVLPSGEVLSVTTCLEHKTDEQLRAISDAIHPEF